MSCLAQSLGEIPSGRSNALTTFTKSSGLHTGFKPEVSTELVDNASIRLWTGWHSTFKCKDQSLPLFGFLVLPIDNRGGFFCHRYGPLHFILHYETYFCFKITLQV